MELNQRLDVRADSRSQSFQAIAAFQNRNQPASCMLVRNLAHHFGKIREIGVGQHEVAEWITDPGIESGRDQHQARLESFSGGQQLLLKRSQDFFAAGTRGKRAVERGPLARALA